jgi:hypothetical protein
MELIDVDSGGAWVPQACTLPASDRALRVAEFDGLFAAAGCCSFFTFALTAASGRLTLEVTVPAPQAGVLDALADRAAAAAGLSA